MLRTITTGAIRRIVAGVLALLILVPAGMNAQSDMKKKYPKMGPIDEYLMNRDTEIEMARTAAPVAISHDATVLVLKRKGWVTAVKGSNGFVCMVERAWASSIDFPKVWNPKIKGPDCLNPAAAQTILPIVYKLTQMGLAGDSEQERIAGIQAAFAKKEIPPLEPGAIGFMMSKEQYLSDSEPHNFVPHVMVFVPTRKTDSEWGAWLPHVPLGSASYWFPNPGHDSPLEHELPPLRVLFIEVPKWSDGTSELAK